MERNQSSAIEQVDNRVKALAYNNVSCATVRYRLEAGKVKTDSEKFQLDTAAWFFFIKIKDLDFEMIAADNNWVVAKERGKGSIWAAELRAGKKGSWQELGLPGKSGLDIQDIGYGCNDGYEAGTVYAMTTDGRFYFSDVWVFANGWKLKEFEIPLPDGHFNSASRMDATNSAVLVTADNNFFGAWYDVYTSKYCLLVPHIKWKADNKWCKGNYPVETAQLTINKKSIRAKRRFEERSIEEERKMIESLYGKSSWLLPRRNLPPTAESASHFYSDDDKAPVDILLDGTYKDKEGIFYGKITWDICKGLLSTEWYFRPGLVYPLSFTREILNCPETIRLGTF